MIFVLSHTDQDRVILVRFQPAEGIAALPRFAAVNTVLRTGNSGDSQLMGAAALQNGQLIWRVACVLTGEPLYCGFPLLHRPVCPLCGVKVPSM